MLRLLECIGAILEEHLSTIRQCIDCAPRHHLCRVGRSPLWPSYRTHGAANKQRQTEKTSAVVLEPLVLPSVPDSPADTASSSDNTPSSQAASKTAMQGPDSTPVELRLPHSRGGELHIALAATIRQQAEINQLQVTGDLLEGCLTLCGASRIRELANRGSIDF